MKKKAEKTVREPLQVYLAPDERALLDEVAARTGLSRAEVLRRGLRSFAADQAQGSSPLLDFLLGLSDGDWPADLAERHDDHLADAYRGSQRG